MQAYFNYIIVCLLIPFKGIAQYPNLSSYKVSPVSPLTFSYKNCFLNKACYEQQKAIKTEVPPWTIGDSTSQFYFLVDGRKTALWSSSALPAKNGILNFKKEGNGPLFVTRPYVQQDSFQPGIATQDWKRNYHAVYSAHLLERAAERLFIGFCHGENKNEITTRACADATDDERWQNTLQPNVTVELQRLQYLVGRQALP
ncbi:MAG: hypothetical protein JWP69_330 [Flaviaesturariibacter sp.]|nr:hypothetical protein [Flaviaesturariibacter sp.]